MASTVLTAVVGIGFWAAAARLYPTADVGRDAILISALLTLSAVCQLNLVDVVFRFLPGIAAARRPRMIATAYAATTAAAIAGGVAFVLLAPMAVTELQFMSDDRALSAAFVASLVFWGLFVIQDAVLASLRRAVWVPVENLAFSVAKVVALPLMLAAGAIHGVFLAWVLPGALIVVIVNYLLFTRVLVPAARALEPTPPSSVPPREKLAGFLAQDYVGFVLLQAPTIMLPIVVLTHLGAEANAYFTIPFVLVLSFDLLFYSATMSLTVEAAHAASRTPELARTVSRRFLIPQVAAAVCIVIAAPLVLLPFGSEYVENGASTLRLLACASIFRVFVYLFVALARLRASGTQIMLAQGGLAVISVSAALLLVDSLETPGVALGWLIANVVVALATAPSLYRFLRPTPVTGATS